MGKIYANLKDITDGNKDWNSLDKYVDMKDLVIRSSTIDKMWVHVRGKEQEAIDNLYDIMDSENDSYDLWLTFRYPKRVGVFQEGRIIPEDEGYLEIDATKDVISIDEYNKLGECVDSVMMDWKSYGVMKEYLENLKKKICD